MLDEIRIGPLDVAPAVAFHPLHHRRHLPCPELRHQEPGGILEAVTVAAVEVLTPMTALCSASPSSPERL